MSVNSRVYTSVPSLTGRSAAQRPLCDHHVSVGGARIEQTYTRMATAGGSVDRSGAYGSRACEFCQSQTASTMTVANGIPQIAISSGQENDHFGVYRADQLNR